MTLTLAVDPGSTHSAFCVIDADRRPIGFAKAPNDELLENLPLLALPVDVVALEMVASYGMPVGVDVFETVRWIGRFEQALTSTGRPPRLVFRRMVKLHHCGSSKAKDANITQALIDRFAPGQPNRGKGTKAAPGWFYGFAADVWAAYALAVYVADTNEGAL